jgi:hypothetical protein
MQASRARSSARAAREVPALRARWPWAPAVAAGVLLALVALKAVGPEDEPAGASHRRSLLTLCSDPWLLPNALMVLGETSGAIALSARAWRPVGAAIGLLTMSCAALFSVYAGIAHVDLSGCGCFGPFDAPWWVHLAVAVAAAVPCAFALPSAPRPSSQRRCEAAERAVRALRLPSVR